MGISAHTGKAISTSTLSSVLSHQKKTGHNISVDNFSVLSSRASQLNVLIRESLLISKLQPSLNANIRCFPLTLFR